MILVEVTSSQIKAVGYDKDAQILVIEFKTKTKRSVYRYENVSDGLAAAVIFAESIGKMFGQSIKAFPGLYPFSQLSQEDAAPLVVGPASEAEWYAELRAIVKGECA